MLKSALFHTRKIRIDNNLLLIKILVSFKIRIYKNCILNMKIIEKILLKWSENKQNHGYLKVLLSVNNDIRYIKLYKPK